MLIKKIELDLRPNEYGVAISKIAEVCNEIEDQSETSILAVILNFDFTYEGASDSILQEISTKYSTWEKVLRRLETLEAAIVFISKCHIGFMGVGLMMVCDYRVLAHGAKLRAADDIGSVFPGMYLYRLAREVRKSMVRQLVVLGRTIDSEDAVGSGIADISVDSCDSCLETIISTIRPATLKNISLRRALINDAHNDPYEVKLGEHLAACERFTREFGLDKVTKQ